jgi:hypothetical protein
MKMVESLSLRRFRVKKKRFLGEQIIQILREAERGERTIGEICRLSTAGGRNLAG